MFIRRVRLDTESTKAVRRLTVLIDCGRPHGFRCFRYRCGRLVRAKERLDICAAALSLVIRLNTSSASSMSKAEAVLLVDDDDLCVRATTRHLRALGYPYVFRASSAAEALTMLERVRPTVVLTDMVMENRSAGRWVIAAARKLGIAAAVISGLPGIAEQSHGLRVLNKADLDASTLEALMSDLVAEHRRQRRDSTSRLLVSLDRSRSA